MPKACVAAILLGLAGLADAQDDLCNESGTPTVEGVECRAAADVCDVAEVCDGTTFDCPTDSISEYPTWPEVVADTKTRGFDAALGALSADQIFCSLKDCGDDCEFVFKGSETDMLGNPLVLFWVMILGCMVVIFVICGIVGVIMLSQGGESEAVDPTMAVVHNPLQDAIGEVTPEQKEETKPEGTGLRLNIQEHMMERNDVICSISKAYSLSVNESNVEEYFKNGLSDADVKKVRDVRASIPAGGEGPLGLKNKPGQTAMLNNMLSPPPVVPEWQKFGAHLVTGFAILLEVASALCFIAYAMDSSSKDNWSLAWVLFSVVAINAIFSYWQDRKAEAAMAAFADMTSSLTEVQRNGKRVIKSQQGDGSDDFNASELVVGDLVFIELGAMIPADVYMIDFGDAKTDIKVNNSNLTGEPLPLTRKVFPHDQVGKGDADLDHQFEEMKESAMEATNLAFFGTPCVEGNGAGIVIRMSDETSIGQIADQVLQQAAPETLMQKEIGHFIHIVTGIAVILGVSFFIFTFAKGTSFINSIIFMIAIIVANVPEGLLMTITIGLTLTAKNMAAKKVLVKNVETVETLGSVTVIASDKTGTLTQNNMTTYRCQYDNELRSCDADYTWPLESSTTDAGAVEWDGKATPYFDPTNPVFEELRLCCLLCRSTFFKHTVEITKSADKTNLFGKVIEEGKTSIDKTLFWKLPIKMRETAGDASETGFVRFLEELKLKGDSIPSIQDWKPGVKRPILDYDKYELTMKARVHPAFEQYVPEGEYATLAKGEDWPQGEAEGASITQEAEKQAKIIADGGTVSPADAVPYIDLEKAKYPEIDKLPFNSKNKFMATINEVDGERVLFIKGAGEKVLDMCAKIMRAKGSSAEAVTMDDDQMASAVDNLAAMAESGERVLGFAKVTLPAGVGAKGAFPEGKIAQDVQAVIDTQLIFLGHMSLMDPAREEVPGAIHDCRTAGVAVVMVTGDHPKTASAIAAKIGIIEKKADALERWLGIGDTYGSGAGAHHKNTTMREAAKQHYLRKTWIKDFCKKEFAAQLDPLAVTNEADDLEAAAKYDRMLTNLWKEHKAANGDAKASDYSKLSYKEASIPLNEDGDVPDDYEPKDEDLGDEFEAYFGWCSKAVTGPKIASKVALWGELELSSDGQPLKDEFGVEDLIKKELRAWFDRLLLRPDLVFARTQPEQKQLIVRNMQRPPWNSVVAVTGDGVNDSPALKKADVGVAMYTGSEVAKDAADMVLVDDNFSSIVEGVRQGRIIFDNLKKSIAYTLSSNIPEISPFLSLVVFEIPVPLETVMILCIDLGTDLLPAVSFAYEKPEADIMKRMPRDRFKDKLVTWQLVFFAYGQIGMIQATAGFFVYFMVMQRYLAEYGVDVGDLGNTGFSWQSKTVPLIFGCCDEWTASQHTIAGCKDVCTPAECRQANDANQKNNFELKDKCGFSPDMHDAGEGYSQAYTNDFSKFLPTVPWESPRYDDLLSQGARPTGESFPNNMLDYMTRMEIQRKAQTSYLFSIIVVQWADVIICKTRVLSVFQHGMGNMIMNLGIVEETALGLAICYVPFFQELFTSSSPYPTDMCWALPFSFFILFYDEVRKFLMRLTGGTKRDGYLYKYTYW